MSTFDEPSLFPTATSSIMNLLPSRSQTSYTAVTTNHDLLFSVVVDNYARIRGEQMEEPAGAIKFDFDMINLIIHPQTDELGGTVVVVYGEAKIWASEWVYTTQLRIKTGTADRKTPIRLVDKGLFRIGKWLPPIKLRVVDSAVKRIKLEFKFTNMLYEQLPYFHAGDVVLQFKGGTTLCADKNLLALHSRYMGEFRACLSSASLLYEAADGAIIDMGDFEMEAFRELLYQIYATRRPIETDLPRIARAANAYRADIILSKLTTHIRALDVSSFR
ncbi:unnamed protein product [Anisakis simplex]|uniref:BTB domain-containing protein n=1 Tax=Anisakis simplex TaxID=6269 RepID=A0A0M3J1B8_ANISI|nr:unnamed protein product [Anisakis simplex]